METRDTQRMTQTTQMTQITETFHQIATMALANPQLAQQVRDALIESGILGVFGVGAATDVVDLLDTAGEQGLRAYLRQMSLAQLRELTQARGYDPEKTSARWRSANKFIDLIVAGAQKELEEDVAAAANQPAALAAASWML